MRRFELSEGTSNKFWQITQEGASLRVTFGKNGTAGQTQLKDLGSDAAATAEHDKLVREKVKKGYAEVDSTGAPSAPAPAAPKPAAAKPVQVEAPEPAAAPSLPKAAPAAAPIAFELPEGVEPWVVEEVILPDPDATPASLPDPEAGSLAELAKSMSASDRANVAAGRAGSAVELQHGIDALLALLAADTPPTSLEVDTGALMIVYCREERAFAYLVAQHGFPFAITAYLRATQIGRNWSSGASNTAIFVSNEAARYFSGMRALRELKPLVPAAAWKEGIELLAAARRTQPSTDLRAEYNIVAQDPAWAREDAARVEAGYEHAKIAVDIMGACDDLELIASVSRKFPGIVLDSSVQLLERFGLAAVPLALETFAKDPTTSWNQQRFVRIQTLACAKLFAQSLTAWNCAESAHAYFAARPDLAILALAPAVAAEGKLAPFAKAPLAAAIAARPDLPARLAHLLDAKTRAFLFAPPPEVLPAAKLEELPAALQKLSPEGAPKKAAPLPTFVADLPQIRVRGTQTALPDPAVAILLTSLRHSKIGSSKKSDADEVVVTAGTVLPGITAAKEACEPADLAAFAWQLFSTWQAATGPSKESWAFTALGLLGNDDTARRLTPLIRAWPGETLHARATVGLDVLAAIGTDVALMNLHGISQKLKFKALQERAREKIAAVATTRGFTAEELADRLVPDFDLDEEGGHVLDFGPRQFAISFDETLKPQLRGPDGKLLSDLPKPGKQDDTALATAAVERWKALKKDAKAIAQGQVLRLELAMCSERRWPADVFRTFLVEHPVVVHLVRRLVWATTKGDAIDRTFRVAEDGSFASEADDTFELPEGAVVTLPHRLALTDAQLGAWAQILADYGILQPFDQLGRATYLLAPADAKKSSLDPLKSEVKTGAVLGLEARGWRKSPAEDAGWVWSMWKPLTHGVTATLTLAGGICIGWSEGTPSSQKVGPVSLASGKHSTDSVPLSALSKTAYSELVREIEGLSA